VLSACADGSCIIWDLSRFVRLKALFENTFFKAALYHPDESQILTTGTDRKIAYWDAFDGACAETEKETKEKGGLTLLNRQCDP
jgi:WD40 repeat protein